VNLKFIGFRLFERYTIGIVAWGGKDIAPIGLAKKVEKHAFSSIPIYVVCLNRYLMTFKALLHF